MSTRIAVRTLGTVAIEIGERRIGPSSGRLFALVLYLASLRGHPIPRRVAQELLFSAAPDGHAAHSLRQLVYRLRQIGAPIEADADQLSLPLEHVTVDWWQMVSAEFASKIDLERLAHGIFPGYNPNISEQYREWFEAERAETSVRLRRAITQQLVQLRRAGRWDIVDMTATALLALDPLSEEGTLARAEVLAVAGSKTAALRVIDQYLQEVGEQQPHLRIAPAALRRRISERLPELGQGPADERLFVGRVDVMRSLSVETAATRTGNQRVLLLWGEAGIGKTRVLCEYRLVASLQGSLTQMQTCQPHDVHRPLGILSDLAIALLQFPGALGCDPDARALLERLVSLNSHIGSARESTHATMPLSAIVRSLSDLVSAIAAEGPLLVLIDDAQWMDSESLHVVLGALAGPVTRRSCLIMGSRDRTLLAGADSYTDRVSSFRLNPLDASAASELARSLLKLPTGLEGYRVEEEILGHARGNPLFIRVLCSHFAATNDYESLKHTVREILVKRLEQVSSEAIRVLETCVVLAKNCTYTRLESVLEIPRYRLLRAIEELDDRGLITVSDGCIVSSHALLSDAVIDRMSTTVLQGLHATAAELLQREMDLSHAARLRWDCAEHWRIAGNHPQAIAALRACAQRAIEVGRPADALKTYRRALALNATDDVKLQLVECALSTVWFALDFAEAEDLLSMRRSLRAQLRLPPASHDRYEILAFACILHNDGDPFSIIGQLQQCVECATASARHRLAAARQLVIIADLTIDLKLARSALHAIRDVAPRTTGHAHAEMMFHTCFGDTERAIGLAATIANARKTDIPKDIGILLNVGYAQGRLGNLVAAQQTLARTLSAARRKDMISVEIHATLFLAQLYWHAERVVECRDWFERLVDLLSRNSSQEIVTDYCILGARLATQEGRYDAAYDFIGRAQECKQSRLELPRLLLGACSLDVQISAKDPCSESDLNDLLALHKRAQNLGGQDEIVTALVRALRAHNRTSEAVELLRTYARHRRGDRFQKRSDLMQLAHELGVLELDIGFGNPRATDEEPRAPSAMRS